MEENSSLLSPARLGAAVKARRRRLGLSQADAALASGVGIRFLSDLENGKETVQLGKVLQVLRSLGLQLTLGEARPFWEDRG